MKIKKKNIFMKKNKLNSFLLKSRLINYVFSKNNFIWMRVLFYNNFICQKIKFFFLFWRVLAVGGDWGGQW